MARTRKNPADAKLPQRVYRGKTKYEFHPARGGSISLCPLDAPLSVIWMEYERILCDMSQKEDTVSELIKQFLLSTTFQDLATETKKDYQKYANKLLPVFGKMSPDNVKPEHVRKYMDKRGLKSRTQANREKTFFSRVYKWGYKRGMVKGNPCTGVKQARERYITDTEYTALYSVSPTIVKMAMELAYLCCARQADVLSLTRSQLMEQGIFIRQGKTGKQQIKAWTKRLEDAVKLSETLITDPGIFSIYVICQASGHKYTRDGFNSRWKKAKQLAKETFPELDFNFTFHDLKAKGISDLDGTLAEKQVISGHKNMAQTARYNRKIEVVPVVGGQRTK
ncbi:tyrosine-type recombinase/integrase [Xenorhabdus szentirmaii]|uniref:tyrosine-type recombinase/integrase n=1 Tax=Xenorhabdus szentirmaii TaxID=290112 RepID=UPI00199CDA7F|nr:tyrosine-type recombinase/integrase [Xenorhabdus sp. 38]MBD2782429.1 tyrosine-type recombinase/integrase [Xenorhabdus sp. 38]